MALAGKVAVVTGGAMGIGRASAVRLASEGADVAIMDIAEADLKETKALIEAQGRKAMALKVNLLERKEIDAAFAEVEAKLGPIDILHNNVGQSAREQSKWFWESGPEVWDFIIDINLRTAIYCTKQVAGGMKDRRRGRIINMSSEAAYVGGMGMSDYSAAKAGIIGFTRSLALELAPHQVTVNAICPGPTRTRAMDQLPKNLIDPIIAAIPMKSLIEPEDIAHAVAFFASEGARFVTGTHLLVNGGRVIA
jgi:NAD(P)-dependent dehydrogenase (short-subunit alcohol dehydrogenase family)